MITRRLTSALLIALLISGISTFWLSQKFVKPRAASPPGRSQYVAAVSDMEAGQVIQAQNLHLIDWPANMPLQGASNVPQPLIGRMVLYPLSAGEPILERHLSPLGPGNGMTVKIPDGMRALALRTDEVVGVAGFLLPGTYVDVLVTLHLANSPNPVTVAVLEDAEVLAAGQKTEPDPAGKPTSATVVTILVNPQDAEKVVLASSQGAIHFVLRNGSDRQQVKGPPVLLSQLSGITVPALKKPIQGVVRGVAQKSERPALKLYTVETFMGATVKTDNFQ